MACSWRALSALCPSCSQTLCQAARQLSIGLKFSPGLMHRLALSAPSHQLSLGPWISPVPHAIGPLHVSVLSGNDFPKLSVGDISSMCLLSASVECGTQAPSLYYGCLCHQTYRPWGQGLDPLGSPPHLPLWPEPGAPEVVWRGWLHSWSECILVRGIHKSMLEMG